MRFESPDGQMSPCYSEIHRGRAVEPHSRNWGSRITWLTFVGRPLHDQSAIFVLPSYFFAMDNYYPVTLQAHGAWYHVQVLINVTIQVQCLFVTWLPRYKVLAFTKENHEDKNQFSLPLWRDSTHGLIYITGNFVPSRKDHFPRITLPLTNQIAWFVTLHCDLSIAEWSCSKAILKWTNTSGLNLSKLPWSRVYGAFDTTIGQSDCTICNTLIRQS